MNNDKLLSALAQTFRRYPAIERAVLFGSRARGEHSEQSDYDVAVYGALTGALAERKLPDLAKLFVAQIGGRVCKAAAMAFAFYCLQSPIGMDMLLSSLLLGIPGILLQWAIIPPLFSFAKDASENG